MLPAAEGEFPDSRRLHRLTPLRFVAASLVVFFHFGQPFTATWCPWLLPLARQGSVAVSFFFCLSGFIMASVYRTPLNADATRSYWVARFARIYPLYLLGLLATLPLRPWQASELALSALMLQAWVPGHALDLNAPGWSLSVEAVFYAVFPWIAGRTLARPGPAITAALLLWLATQALTAFGASMLPSDPSPSTYQLLFYFPLLHLNEFVMGVAAAALAQRFDAVGGRVLLALLAAAAAVLATASLLASLGWPVSASNGLYAPLFSAGFWTVVALPRAGWLEHRWLRALGESSYAVYILQVPVMAGLGLVLPLASGWNFGPAFAVLVAVSLASYVLVERPLRQWAKSAWARRLRPWAA